MNSKLTREILISEVAFKKVLLQLSIANILKHPVQQNYSKQLQHTFLKDKINRQVTTKITMIEKTYAETPAQTPSGTRYE